MREPKRYEAILFDFDGVLADTEPLHCEAWRRALEPLGIHFDWEFYRRHGIGISDGDLLALLAGRAARPKPVSELWARFPLKQKIFIELASQCPPVPGAIRELLGRLHDYPLAVVSSTSRLEIHAMLQAAGIAPHFRAVICAEDVRRHKPDPEPYLEAARRLGVTKALVVEDSEAGAQAGRAAGFEVVKVSGPQEVPGALERALGVGFVR